MKKSLLSLCLLLVMSACGDTTPSETRDTLRIGIKSEPVTLHPYESNDSATANISAQIFENLISKDVDGKLIPELAVSWKFNSPTNLYMELRSNVYFQNGELLTPEDIKFSIETMTQTPGIQHIVSPVKDVAILSPNSFQINLKTPFAPILAHLSHPAMVILNKKAVLASGESVDQEPVGTGPYQLKEWNRGNNLSLTKNTNYWGKEALTPNLFFIVIPENSSRTIALETGDIDMALGIPAVDRDRILENSELKLIERELPSIEYLGFNQGEGKNPLWKDKRIREAAALAVDVPGIINSVFFGAATPSGALTHKSMIGHYDGLTARKQDLERAKDLIKEANILDKDNKVIFWAIEGERQKILEVVQANFKEIGLNVEIQILEWARFLDGIGKGEHDGLLLGWSDGTGDSDYTLFNMMHSSTKGPGGNRSFYGNPELDKYLESARSELDPAKRAEYYKLAQEFIYNNVTIIPLLHKQSHVGLNKNVEGFQLMSTDDLVLSSTYFK